MLTTYDRYARGGKIMAKRNPYIDQLLLDLERARADLRDATQRLEALTAQMARQAVKDTVRGMEGS